MEYLTISQTAEKWGLKGRWVTTLCSEGRIPGARKFGNAWMIPADAEKTSDARIKSGNYIGLSQRSRDRSKGKNDSSAPPFESSCPQEKSTVN